MVRKFPATAEHVAEITEYAISKLSSTGINSKLLYEYRLMIEELTLKLVRCAKPNAELSVEFSRKLRKSQITFTCAGDTVLLAPHDGADLSGFILEEYSDYLTQSYAAGMNRVIFSTSVSDRSFMRACIISIVLSLLTSVLFQYALPASVSEWFLNNSFFHSVVLIFTNFISCLAVPVSFFSVASSITSLIMTRQRNSRLSPLISGYILSTLAAICVGFGTFHVLNLLNPVFDLSKYTAERISIMGNTLIDFINSSVPANIISPFIDSNPLPLLILAVAMGISSGSLFGTAGKNIREGIEALKSLFCRMLGLFYNALPVFLYFALLSGWVSTGFQYYLRTLVTLLFILVPVAVFFLLYAIRLRVCGITLKEFYRDYSDVLKENYDIGSNILAMPYNRRMLRRKTGLPRGYLQDSLRLGTVMNMNGSSLLASFCIVFLLHACGIQLTVLEQIAALIVLILLSIGAPNQPGSLILVMLVLMKFLGVSQTFVANALVVEAVYGKLYSFINSMGDVVEIVLVSRRKH